MFDHDGPSNPAPDKLRRTERELAEMLRLARGVLFDGVVTEDEALSLLNWAEAHPGVVSAWPGSVIHRRLKRIFADGIVSDDERTDLATLLEILVSEETGTLVGIAPVLELPLDAPPPRVNIPGRVFVLAGRFVLAPRAMCEELLRRAGGRAEESVTPETDYLIVGTFGSKDWTQTPAGRKIEQAVRYREKYGKPAIIGEDHWAAAVAGVV